MRRQDTSARSALEASEDARGTWDASKDAKGAWDASKDARGTCDATEDARCTCVLGILGGEGEGSASPHCMSLFTVDLLPVPFAPPS